MTMIIHEWGATEWGYGNNKIEPFDAHQDFEKYQTKTGMDSLLLDCTHIGASVLTNSREVSRRNLRQG